MHNPSIAGYPVIVTPHLTKTIPVDRTWRERLFTRPWRPWVSTKWVTVPSKEFYMIDAGWLKGIVCHPSVECKLREMLDALV